MSRYPHAHSPNVYPSYKGGRTVVSGGYLYEFCPDHPSCDVWGYLLQHQLVAEGVLGRPLAPAEIVHHQDENKLNNDPGNLLVMTRKEHQRYHILERARKYMSELTDQMACEALQGRTLHQAAAMLGISHQTFRRRWPHLLVGRIRRSPVAVHDPQIVALVRVAAADPLVGYKEFAEMHHIEFDTVKKICAIHDIEWVRKTKKGEKHTQYQRKTATLPQLTPGD